MCGKVTIIIPVYNGAEFIDQTIKSVLKQDYTDIQIIVADDNSSDNSINIIKKLMIIDNRVQLVKNRQNLGLMKNNNNAVGFSEGEYLLFLGQDDLLQSDHITKMMSHFTDNVVAVFCDYYTINDNNMIMSRAPHCKHSQLDSKDFIKKNPVPSCGLIIRKEAFVTVGGFRESQDHPNYGEYDLWIRLAGIGKFNYCDEAKGLYRRHANNLTNTFVNYTTKYKVSKYLNQSRLLLFKNKDLSLPNKLYLVIFISLKKMRSLSFYLLSKVY